MKTACAPQAVLYCYLADDSLQVIYCVMCKSVCGRSNTACSRRMVLCCYFLRITTGLMQRTRRSLSPSRTTAASPRASLCAATRCVQIHTCVLLRLTTVWLDRPYDFPRQLPLPCAVTQPQQAAETL